MEQTSHVGLFFFRFQAPEKRATESSDSSVLPSSSIESPPMRAVPKISVTETVDDVDEQITIDENEGCELEVRTQRTISRSTVSSANSK